MPVTTPHILTPHHLASDPSLTSEITHLINVSFARSKVQDPGKWGTYPPERFPTSQTYLDTLGPKGVVGVIFDSDASSSASSSDTGPHTDDAPGEEAKQNGRLVAVAALIPWTVGEQGESGWEVKAVAVDGSAAYQGTGLMGQLLGALERIVVASGTSDVSSAKKYEVEETTLWVAAAECINGAYWRRRGFREVRRRWCNDGEWDCLTRFEMVVLRREVGGG